MEKSKRVIIPSKSEPEWTEELENKKIGDTTLKTCGWCKHRGSGSYRHDCMIEGSCSLLPEYDDEREVRWDTPCVIISKGKEDIRRYVQSHKYEIEESKRTIKREQSIIKELKLLLPKVKQLPPLPNNRNPEHFNVGDRVAVYYKDDLCWKFGTVVYGYRHHDGCVSFHLDETLEPTYDYLPATKMEPGKYPGGEITQKMADKMNKDSKKLVKKIGKLANSPGCGTSVPTVMLKKEYDYFAKYPEEWENWRDTSCSKDYNGKPFYTGDVFDKYSEFCKASKLKQITQRRISDIIGEFDMLGLITTKVISRGRGGKTREIRLAINKNLVGRVEELLVEGLNL